MVHIEVVTLHLQMRRMGPPMPPRLTHNTPTHMGPYSANGENGGGGNGRHPYSLSPYHHQHHHPHHQQHGPPPPLLHHGGRHHGGPVMRHGGLSPSLSRGPLPPPSLPPSQSPPMRVQPSPDRQSQVTACVPLDVHGNLGRRWLGSRCYWMFSVWEQGLAGKVLFFLFPYGFLRNQGSIVSSQNKSCHKMMLKPCVYQCR